MKSMENSAKISPTFSLRIPYFSELQEGEEDPHPCFIVFFFLILVALVELTGNGYFFRDKNVNSVVGLIEIPHLDSSLFSSAAFAGDYTPETPPLRHVMPETPPFQGAEGIGTPKPSMSEPMFWFIWSTGLREWHWMPMAVVESVFKFHPRAHVVFLSLIMPLDFFDCFKAAGFDIEVKRYDLRELSQGTVIENFVSSGRLNVSTYFRYAHESDLVRLVVLAKYGGIYVDTDVLLLRPFDAAVLENPTLGVEYYQDRTQGSKTFGGLRLNNAFMGFPEPGNPFLDWVMNRVDSNYNPKEWAAIGPDLITEGYKAQEEGVQDAFHLIPPLGLYPLHWARAHTVLNPDRTEVNKDWPVEIRNETYAIHLYNSNSWRYEGGS